MTKRPTFEELERMNVQDLTQLIEDAIRAKASAEQKARRELLSQMRELAQKNGMTLEDVLGNGPSGKAKLAAKYVDPKNPDRTWVGRGRQPAWVRRHIEDGGKLEDLKI